jgi:uncharacterized GH25 family protein
MTQVVVREGETTVHDFRPEKSGGNVKGGVTRDGEPVEGAMVILAGGSVGMQMTSTGPDGSFSFDGIAPGTYTVSVQADLMGGGTSAQEINVDEDGKAETVQLKLTSLSISGRVIDAETGEGVPLAQVILFDGAVGTLSSLEEIMQNQRGQAITDEKGRFEIKGVADDTFAMRVSANGYAESTQPRVSAGASGLTIKITGGVEFEVTVVGPDNEPVSGATVTARDSEGRETMSIGMAALQGATDSSGVSVLRLVPGRYTIVAESSGLPSNSAVVDASRGSVVIRLEQGGGIEVVVTKGGRPLPGARITVLDEAGNALEKRISMGNFMGSGRTTDTAGRAVREGLPAGRLTVVVAPPEGATVKREVDVRRGATEKVTIEVD